VANTRASESICYVLDKFETCIDVDIKWISSAANIKNYELPQEYYPNLPETWTSEIMIDGSAIRFLENNGMSPRNYVLSYGRSQDAVCGLYEALSAYKEPKLSLDSSQARQLAPTMAHLRGYATHGKSALKDEMGNSYVLSCPAELAGRERFYWCRNMREDTKKEDKNALALRNLLETKLAELGQYQFSLPEPLLVMPKNAAPNAYDGYVIHADLYTKMSIKGVIREVFICFEENSYAAMFVGAALWARGFLTPLIVHVCPTAGSVIIYDGFHEKYGFLLDSLRRIHIYAQTTIFRDRYLGVQRSLPHNYFAIDTEFIEGKYVYEVGLLCISDPYRSLSSVLHVKGLDNARLAKMGITREAYDKIGEDTIDFNMRLAELANQYTEPVLVAYYAAKNDVEWLFGVTPINIAEHCARITPTRGTFESDSHVATLDALYTTFVGPVENSSRHRAFTDSVMLAEIILGL
jgi:hypothetical protein